MFIPSHERRIMRHDSEAMVPMDGATHPMDYLNKNRQKVSHPSDEYSETQLDTMSYAELAELSGFSVEEIQRRREKFKMCGRDAVVRTSKNSGTHYRDLAEEHGLTYSRLMSARKRMPDMSLMTLIRELQLNNTLFTQDPTHANVRDRKDTSR